MSRMRKLCDQDTSKFKERGKATLNELQKIYIRTIRILELPTLAETCPLMRKNHP